MMNHQQHDDDVFSSSVDWPEQRIHHDVDLAEMLFDRWLQRQEQQLHPRRQGNDTAGSSCCYNNAFSTHYHHQHHNDDDDDDDYDHEEEEKNKLKITTNGAFGRVEPLVLTEENNDEPLECGWRAMTAATDVSLSSSWSSWTSFGTLATTTNATTMTMTMTSRVGDTVGRGPSEQLSQLRRLFESKLPPLPSSI
jgi:hypothetical protein